MKGVDTRTGFSKLNSPMENQIIQISLTEFAQLCAHIEARHPLDYSTQLYVLNNELNALAKMQTILPILGM